MSTIIKQVAAYLLPCRTPLTQYQRYRGKINIQRPRKPHYERAKVMAVTQPFYPELDKAQYCFRGAQEQKMPLETINPYSEIIAREVRNWLEHSRMIVMFHLNSINSDELFRVRVQLHKQNMHLKSYGKKIIAKAVTDTRYQAILPLFESNNCIVFSTEQSVSSLLRITRKVPQMLLLAGIVENRLLSRNEFMEYAKFGNIQVTQAELAQTLNMAAGNLVQQLEAHQKNIVNALDVYAKENTTSTDATKDETLK